MESIPFSSLFTALRKNGFAVTQEQVIHTYKIILKYSNKVNEEGELYLYLSPVFAKSEDEQRLFREIFETAFRVADLPRLKPGFRKQFDAQGKKHPALLIGVFILAGLFIISLIVLSYRHYTAIAPSMISVDITAEGEKNIVRTGPAVFRTSAGSAFELKAECYYKHKKNGELTVETVFDWGDGKEPTPGGSHAYSNPGEYKVKVGTSVWYSGEIIQKKEQIFRVLVCPPATLSVSIYGKKDTIPPGKTIRLNAMVTNANEYLLEWREGLEVLGRGEHIDLRYDYPGSHTITCVLQADGAGASCAVEESASFVVAEKKTFSQAQKNTVDTTIFKNDPLSAKTPGEDKRFLYLLYGLLGVAFAIGAIYFFIVYQKILLSKTGWKSPELNSHLQLAVSPTVKKKASEINFPPVDYLIIEHWRIHETARRLRHRVNDNIWLPDIQKTIHKSIEAGGLLQPVKTLSSRQPEYLVLINDNSNYKSITRLFEYFTSLLKKYNLVVETFYFHQQPGRCYNATVPQGISLDKLAARYNKHILLLFSDAGGFVSAAQQKILPVYSQFFYQWQYKAFITPGPAAGWTTAEKLLSKEIQVLPLDMEGLVLLPGIMDQRKTTALFSKRATPDDTDLESPVDFEDITQLERYCRKVTRANIEYDGTTVNVLFEWLKALAVYPKIQWEVLITIGKVILDKYKMPQEFHLDNLLHIVRISWISQAVFPDGIRLALLKALSPANELLAREATLALLDKTAATTGEATPYTEREIQKIIHAFNLYAHDPVKYAGHKSSRTAFEQIWRQDLLNDQPLALYLTNKDRLWQTLPGHNTVKGNISLQQYFEASELEETNLSRIYLWLTIICVIICVSSLFALLILYRWDRIGL